MALATPYLDAIKKFEGYTPRASWDYKQHSIGYGTKARFPGETIDQAEADRRFQQEITSARDQVRALGVPLQPGQEAALTSLTYNAGPKWMASGLGQAVKSGDWQTAGQRFQEYNKAGGQVLPGLQSRRAQEAAWLTGSDPGSSQPPMMLGGPKEQAGAPPMALSDSQQQGFSLDNWMMSPLFQMGAGVLGAPNIGQGLMQGSQAASQFATARQKQQREAELFPLQKQLLQAQVTKAEQPPTSQDLTEYAAARAQELEAGRQPPSILQFLARKKAQGNGRTPIMGIGPDGRPVAMVIGDNPDGTPALLNATAAPGYSVDPRNVTKIDTGTGTQVIGNSGNIIANVNKDIAGAKVAAEVGEASGKAIAGLPKAEQALRSYEAQQGIVTQDIDKALAAADQGYSTGLTGALAGKMPGTKAYDLARTLDTIKANIGFDKLQQMRAESPTGGALGAVAVQELEMLQAVLGSVGQAQSKEQLKANLSRLKETLNSFGERRRQAYAEDVKRYGGAVVGPPNVPINANPSGAPAAPLHDFGNGVKVNRKLD